MGINQLTDLRGIHFIVSDRSEPKPYTGFFLVLLQGLYILYNIICLHLIFKSTAGKNYEKNGKIILSNHSFGYEL